MKAEDIEISIADWAQDKNDLKQIRTEVFIVEQHVPVELEWDEDDNKCVHFIVRNNGNAIATARLKPDGHIGRMAVLKPDRTKGVGAKLLKFVLTHAENQGMKKAFLNAQVNVIGFYEKHGFIVLGDEFLDAGIPHRAMQKNIL